MPLTIPALDRRDYEQLRQDALARAPVHTPEWTNFNESDPGVTLVDMFAFLTESLIYRANLIPERNRLKFLSLLGVALQPGASAHGFVTIINERGALQTYALNDGLEVRAGQVPFRTTLGLDVLPVEMQVFYKKVVDEQNVAKNVQETYRQLYSSYLSGPSGTLAIPQLYETVPFPLPTAGAAAREGESGVNMSEAVGGAIWIAILLRAGDGLPDDGKRRAARVAIANRTLSLGILPVLPDENGRHLDPIGRGSRGGGTLLRFDLPDVPPDGKLARGPASAGLPPMPSYTALQPIAAEDVLAEPGIVQLRLPGEDKLSLWTDLDPLEMGVGDLPPSLEDNDLADRLLTWLRITAPVSVQARLLWVGGNATLVSQRARIASEALPDGTGQPDQIVTLSQKPVVPGSVQLDVAVDGRTERWDAIPDLFMAGPEVAVPDPRLPPGTPPPRRGPVHVYVLDPESGQIRFGDGTHGARVPADAKLTVTYDRGHGSAGNVADGAINQAAALPAGLKVTNPVRTWGGVEAESVAQGEKQVARTLQHQDRLVTAADFETITYRTPGIDVGRVEVLPAYSPELGGTPGGASGAVTLLVIPRHDPNHPNAPMPDRLFLDAVCEYLDQRRLVTTEVFLRGPSYRAIWVAIGIEIAPRVSLAQIVGDIKAEVERFLSPLPPPGTVLPLDEPPLFLPATPFDTRKGWPLRKPVRRLELAAVANRVPGVVLVNDVVLIDDTRTIRDMEVPMGDLELPYLGGIAVGIGSPPPPDAIPGFGPAAGPTPPTARIVPVPIIPIECR